MLSGLAGLHCYFMCLSHVYLEKDGIAAWLIPAEILDVNYGREIKKYLLSKLTILRIHKFNVEEAQFKDAMITSIVIWVQNQHNSNTMIEFTYGSSLLQPLYSNKVASKDLDAECKWSSYFCQTEMPVKNPTTIIKIGDLFDIKRGVVTGNNKYFIWEHSQIHFQQIPFNYFRPLIPSVKKLKSNVIEANDDGSPKLDERLYLFSCNQPLNQIADAKLQKYIADGVKQNVCGGYLCSKRTPWYLQEQRKPCPYFCSYMARENKSDGSSFRFFLNYSNAIATNTFLMMYPKNNLQQLINRDKQVLLDVHELLNNISSDVIKQNARVYSGGMMKLEPSELLNIPINYFAEIVTKYAEKNLEMTSNLS